MPFFMSKKKIQAMIDEGRRDILNLSFDQLLSITQEKGIRKNQYTTPESAIAEIYNKYNLISDYGVSLVPTIVDTRTSLIAGEGVSVFSENEKVKKWIRNFITKNKLNGSGLIKLVKTTEMEGKVLLVLVKENNEIKIKILSKNKYRVEINRNELEKDVIESCKIGEKEFDKNEFEYIYVSDAPKVAAVLTQIENYERALYDLRNANHLFGFPTPYFQTSTTQEATAITNSIKANKWKIGQSFAGTGSLSFPNPPNSFETLKQEMSLNLKLISSRTGLPVHWLGWTDLMSNRATADELREFISVNTKYEKLIIKESLKSLLQKAMLMAYDNGMPDSIYAPEEFDIDIPDVTMQAVKELSETWLPLAEQGIISYADIRNKIPGIDPLETLNRIELEKNNTKEPEINPKDILNELEAENE